jgi:hypothetical protein
MFLLFFEIGKVESELVLIGGCSHRDVKLPVNQADDEFLCVELCLSAGEHKGLDGLLQTSHGFDELLPGVELVDLSFELL